MGKIKRKLNFRFIRQLICVVFLIATQFNFLFAQETIKSRQFNLPNTKTKTNIDRLLNPNNNEPSNVSSISNVNSKSQNMGGKNYIPGEIVVKFKQSRVDLEATSSNSFLNTFEVNKGLKKKDTIKDINMAIFNINDNQDFDSKLTQLKADPSVEYAEPNYVYQVSSTSFNDPYTGLLRGLPKIHWYETYEMFSGNINTTGTIVAIMDLGVDYSHPELSSNLRDGSNCKDDMGNILTGGCIYGYDFYGNGSFGDNNPFPLSSSHGTHVAGIVAATANNGQGIIGINPNAKIMAIRIGDTSMSSFRIIQGINFAINNGAKIINASFGGPAYSTGMYDAINNFKSVGGLFVTAAGNDYLSDNDINHIYPCDYTLDNIICVAATDQNDDLALFSNYGELSVDLGAPGANIYSTITRSATNNIYINTFDSFLDGFVAGGITSSWGVSGAMAMGGYSGFYSTYLTGIQNSYIEKTVSLTGSSSYEMTFKTYCDTPQGSIGDFIRISFFSGSDEITLLETDEYNDTYINEDNGIYLLDYAGVNYTGVNNGSGYTEDFKFDISKFRNSDLKIRAYWFSDDTLDQIDEGGCFLDYINFDGKGAYDIGRLDGTSMASPYVAGLTSLAWSYSPLLSFSQIRTIIINSGDSLASLSGKTVSGKRINAQNVLLALGYSTGVDWSKIYSSIGQTLSGQGIQNNLNIVSSGDVNNFSGLYFAKMSGSDEIGRIIFNTGLDLTDAGIQEFLSGGISSSIGISQGQMRFNPGTGFIGKNATLKMNLPISFSGMMGNINSGSFTVREASGGTITGNNMITSVYPGVCVGNGNYSCPLYIAVAHFTQFDLRPQLLQINIKSDNSNIIYAKSGNVVMLSFTGSEALTGVSVVINGITKIALGGGISRYSNFTVTGGSDQTLIIFSINYQDMYGNTGNTAISTTDYSSVRVDNVAPILSGAVSVTNTTTQTPGYSFISNESGSISYSGGCTSSTITAISGTNNITFSTMSNAIYPSCLIYVTDIASNQSSLSVPTFTVNYTAPSGGGGGGGGGGITIPACSLSKLICTGGKYVLMSGVNCEGGSLGNSCSISGSVSTGKIKNKTGTDLSWLSISSRSGFHGSVPEGDVVGSPYSTQLNNAYLYAYRIGITTIPSIKSANMTGTLQRSHLAKMIVNYASGILNIQADTGKKCSFGDMVDQNSELRGYIKTACQMGLMGVNVSSFHPKNKVTRAEFGTILSRALRGNINNKSGSDYYSKHLQALKNIGIMTNISEPESIEVRGYVMLMLMRAEDKK